MLQNNALTAYTVLQGFFFSPQQFYFVNIYNEKNGIRNIKTPLKTKHTSIIKVHHDHILKEILPIHGKNGCWQESHS